MTHEDLEREVFAIIAEVTEYSPQEVRDNRSLDFYEELGLDSLLALEMIAGIEKLYKVEFPLDAAQQVRTAEGTLQLTEEILRDAGRM